jgi:hypothetical protein
MPPIVRRDGRQPFTAAVTDRGSSYGHAYRHLEASSCGSIARQSIFRYREM